MERAGVAVWCALCVWVLGMSGVQAQTRYHCRDGNGNTFVLSRPCPEGARTTAAVAGPASAQYSSPRYDSYSPVRSSPETPDHHQYLSARCRALDENIRGAYGRGIKAFGLEVVTDLGDQRRSAGVPALHFYTMNQSAATLEICRRLGI